MPRPSTSRAAAEEIRRSYDKFDRAELLNILSYLTKVYVVDGTMPFSLPGEHKHDAGEETEKELTFAKLIDQLKRRLPKLTELTYFQVEEGKAVLRVGNQKITFGDRVTTEFARASGPAAAAPAAPVAQAPGAAIGTAAAAGTKAAKKTKKEQPPSLSDAEQEALHDISTRFSNLDLD